MSEHDAPRCRLIDLGPDPAAEEVAALAAEVEGAGDEEEVALRGGRRFARRLRRVSLAERARPTRIRQADPEEGAFRLELGAPGAIESVLLRELPGTEPAPGEMRVRVRASGLNFRDVLQALDMLPPGTDAYDRDPGGIGSECAGVVEACGEGVERFRPGDEVIAFASAAHASHVIAREELSVAKPAGLSFTDAAANLAGFVTAEYALNHVARVEPGERVLIHAATGGVGLAALQLCRQAGAHVFATAGTPEKRAYLRELGVEHVMDSRSLAFADEVLRDTGGEGVDVLLNSLSGEATLKGLSILRPYGRFVELGKRDIAEDTRIGLAPFQRNRSYHAMDLVPMTAERPELVRRLMARMARQIEEGALEGIPTTTFDLGDAEQALRFMAQAKHIGKVVLTPDRTTYPVHLREAAHGIDPQGTYLISGGLGGLGMRVAQWLARQGARAVVLMSRSGVPPDGPEALHALRADPTEVRIVRGDVGEEGDVQRVLGEIRRELPPLKGVFHAAMVLDDDQLVNVDRERFEGVLRPKIAGAWHLHRLTRQDDLDHFVSFSSIAAVLGHAMQGSYAAANAFLDTLAAHRQAAGLPAATIAWGAVAGVGYVSRHDDVAEFLGRRGFHRFTPEQTTEVLAAVLRHDVQHLVAASMDWRTWAEVNPRRATSPRFRDLVRAEEAPATSDDAGEGADAVLDRLRAATPAERPAVLSEHLAHKVARILGTTPDKVDPERAFTELGFDSLMAVELVTAIRTDLGVKVPVVTLLQDTNGIRLADQLLSELDLGAGRENDAGDTDEGGVTGPEREPSAPSPEVATGAGTAARELHPLSHAQRRFWFEERLHPGRAANHIAVAARLSGRLDLDAFERGVADVVARHEMLRAAVREVDGTPVQSVVPPAPVSVPVVDLRHRDEPDRNAELQRRATQEIQRPFDLSRGPLLRMTLFRLAQEEHVALLVVHHIATDAWAMNLLVYEIATLYDAHARGVPASLDPPAGSYLDHVERQLAPSDDAWREDLAYWTEQLAGAPADLRLPTEHAPLPSRQENRGAHVRFELSRETTQALRAFARREGVTLFTVLLAAYQTVLHRHSGEEDICVGTAVSTRAHGGAEAVVGCYLNTLVLRADLAGDPPFQHVLAQVRHTILEALKHQEVPFDQVVRALRPERGPEGAPLFRAMLVLHNARVPELHLPGLDLEPVEVETGAAVSDLALLLDDGERLTGTIEYDVGRFGRAHVETIGAHLRTLLQAIPIHPEWPLSALPLASDAERARVLTEWSGATTEAAPPALVHELVVAQVARTPDAVAVESEEMWLTYAELDRRANRLAHRLRALGVGPDVPVGVATGRSPLTGVAALGVLEAGGAYLPLDPGLPSERLRTMVHDAGAPVIVCGPEPVAGLSGTGARVVTLGAEEDDTAAHATARLDAGTTPEHLAYLIYTSGSTGAPKGVMIPHRAFVNQLRWRQETFALSGADGVLQRTPLGFDPSVWELLGPLVAGARVVVPPPSAAQDGAALVRTLVQHRITTLQVTPSVLELLLEDPGLERCESLKRVLCGGEPLPAELAERFLARLPAELHNLYGPAEATIDATHWHCRPGEGRAFMPIGRPIAGARAYLLDARGEPVPPSVPGELYLGGAGVARGYLNRPDPSGERFLPDPFRDEPDAGMVRTGDLARWLPDGNLAFHGRVDRQVKVRGMRVEPAEIEVVLRGHPEVREAAVVASEGDLTAFVVASEGASGAELRRYAREWLPGYMVPAAIHPRSALPRTPHDKIDRDALAREVREPAPRERPRVAPRTEVELRLLGLWEEFLPEQEIGVTDDFFELGGHSLLAMRLLARVRTEFGHDLPVASLFEGRTIEQQAALLGASPEPRRSLMRIRAGGDARPLFCVHPVSGSSMCYAELARALGDARPVYGLDAVGLVGEPPHERIEEMARHYLGEIRRVQSAGPYMLSGWSMGGVIAFEMARQLHDAGEAVAQLVVMDARAPRTAGSNGEAADHTALMHAFARDLGMPEEEVVGALGENGEIDPETRVAHVLGRARGLGLLPPDVRPEDLRARLAVFAANLRAMRAYRPGPYPGPLTVVEAANPLTGDLGGGPRWEEVATGGVARHTVPGDHYTMVRWPHVPELARLVRNAVADAESVAS